MGRSQLTKQGIRLMKPRRSLQQMIQIKTDCLKHVSEYRCLRLAQWDVVCVCCSALHYRW
jgi:hypothetical protein